MRAIKKYLNESSGQFSDPSGYYPVTTVDNDDNISNLSGRTGRSMLTATAREEGATEGDEYPLVVSPRPWTTSKAHAAMDFFLAGAVVNSILPPTVFAELQRYLPKVVEAIVTWFRQFLGENTLTLFPLINIVFLAAVFGAIEIMVRYCINKLEKKDVLIHTPLPGFVSVSRAAALMICCLALAFETSHGYQQDHHDDSAFAQKSHALFLNELFTSFVLFNGGRLATYITRSAIIPSLQFFAKKTGQCCAAIARGLSSSDDDNNVLAV